MTLEILKEELRKAYQDYYVVGFSNNDLTLIDQVVQYPVAYISNGQVKLYDQYPVDPARLKAEKGWDHSRDWSFDVVAISETEGRIEASATRCRADGSVIEHVHAYYAFTRVDGRWKMYALSGVTTSGN